MYGDPPSLGDRDWVASQDVRMSVLKPAKSLAYQGRWPPYLRNTGPHSSGAPRERTPGSHGETQGQKENWVSSILSLACPSVLGSKSTASPSSGGVHSQTLPEHLGTPALPSLLPWSLSGTALSRDGNVAGRRNQPERCRQDVYAGERLAGPTNKGALQGQVQPRVSQEKPLSPAGHRSVGKGSRRSRVAGPLRATHPARCVLCQNSLTVVTTPGIQCSRCGDEKTEG